MDVVVIVLFGPDLRSQDFQDLSGLVHASFRGNFGRIDSKHLPEQCVEGSSWLSGPRIDAKKRAGTTVIGRWRCHDNAHLIQFN